ncbi:DUF502 domain-containing protein [Synoicihabitans lomoniglobus]|uniref:DUF502 domain-containing protein n=1 Tax=Synoicihabitans lomoniglobus TaxID=2909285 RepID=A0AAF0CQC1_9BACT|nr:DUF502 domain-containing protein [Opitutaceae bacterium LMO-M01]WED66099.1 DUF502 domain-containing protein [Opitutaceae bacterium LMO-M01]
MPKPPKSKFTSARNAFLSGLLLLAPLAVTWVVFSWLVDRVGGTFRPFFFFAVPDNLRQESLEIVWNVLATLIVVLLVTTLGVVSRYVFTAYFGRTAERVINNIPGVGSVYRTVKQIVDTFSAQKRNVFEKVVLVEYPAPGSHVVGFLTNRAKGELQHRTESELWTVFIPTTPNPTSGFLIFYPSEKVTELDMTVGDAMKLIISGGTVVPPWPPPAKTHPPLPETADASSA